MDFSSLVIIFAAVGLGAVCKGATGMGMPLIAIPFMATFFGLPQSVAILVLPILLSNIWQVWRFRAVWGDARLGFLIPMLIACAFGVAAGTWFLTTMPERALTLTLGTLLVAYMIFRIARPAVSMGPESAKRWAAPAGIAAGVLHGATGISAPIVVTFIHAMRFGRDQHVFAVSAMFLVLALVQAPALIVAGVLSVNEIAAGGFALIPTILLLPLGQWLGEKLSPVAFDRMILAFLGIIGFKMLLGL